MNIEEFREYCLSLPDVTEATPFEKFSRGRFTILVFYVGGHMFCYFNVDDFTSITVKNHPERIEELKEQYAAVAEPYNGNKKYWMSIRIGADLDDKQVLALVRESYDMVRKKRRTKPGPCLASFGS